MPILLSPTLHAQRTALTALLNSNLANTALVATALKVGLEESTHDIQRHYRRYEISWQTQDIRIVVLTSQLGQLGVPAQGCTNTLMFVGGHGYAVTR